MGRFIKVEKTVVNVDLICAVTERFVRERSPTEAGCVRVQKGVYVFLGTSQDDSCIYFENETVDSFLAKIEVA